MATKLLAIVGSVTPPGRLLSATRWLLDSAGASRKDLEVELINLADKKVAFADGRPPEQYNDDTAAIIERVRAADGVIFASPVYRGSFTGALKNLLDHLPLESLAGKPVGIIAMGATQHHFLGVDWHLRDVLAWFGALLVPTSRMMSGVRKVIRSRCPERRPTRHARFGRTRWPACARSVARSAR